MSALVGRNAAALLVVDVQNAVVAEAYERDETVANIATLVDRARTEGTPVIWVRDSLSGEHRPGTDGWQIVPELVPASGEPIVDKDYGDAFEATDLEDRLVERGIGHLIVVGAQSDACIRSTIHGAFTRGYDTTLVADAHTTEDLTEWGSPPPGDVIAHTNLYWRFQDAPGRTAATTTTAEVTFENP